MVEVTNMLQRMRELSVQSANDTNTADDRAYLDLEFQQLKAETDRIISNTQWNGVNVLDKSFTNNTTAGKFVFQVGANADQTISHTIDVFSLGTADGSGASISAPAAVQAAAPGTGQISTLVLADNYAAGDKITVNLNQSVFQYTVTEADTASSSVLGTNLEAAMDLRFDDTYNIQTSGAGVIKINLTTVDPQSTTANSFTLSASSTDGEWDDIESLSILTQATSNTSVSTLDTALSSVNRARAEIGSVINRLNYAVDNLTNVSQNASASRSRVEDTDYAKATTDLAKSQIIQQAATAMLAQANQQPSAVLSLLQ
jgi:flagellin